MWISTAHRGVRRYRTRLKPGIRRGLRGHHKEVTTDAVNEPRGESPKVLSDAERDEIEAMRRRFEGDAPQAFTDSDANRFERITGSLGVPAFPASREQLLEVARVNGAAESVLVALRSLPD